MDSAAKPLGFSSGFAKVPYQWRSWDPLWPSASDVGQRLPMFVFGQGRHQT